MMLGLVASNASAALRQLCSRKSQKTDPGSEIEAIEMHTILRTGGSRPTTEEMLREEFNTTWPPQSGNSWRPWIINTPITETTMFPTVSAAMAATDFAGRRQAYPTVKEQLTEKRRQLARTQVRGAPVIIPPSPLRRALPVEDLYSPGSADNPGSSSASNVVTCGDSRPSISRIQTPVSTDADSDYQNAYRARLFKKIMGDRSPPPPSYRSRA